MDQITESPRVTPSDPPPRDPATRQAAIWATAVAVPLALVVGLVAFFQLRPADPTAAPATPSASAPLPQSTSPVSVPAPALSARDTVICRALLATLPNAIRDLRQRPVSAGPEQNAAYGDPALTVRCGVPAPTWTETDVFWGVNRVCWRAEETPDAVVLTTVDREVPVAVTVPRAYPEALQWAAPIAEATVASMRAKPGPLPSGCTG